VSNKSSSKRWSALEGRFLLCSGGVFVCLLLWGLYLLLRPPFTMEMVRPGMTIEQVEKLLGEPTHVFPPSAPGDTEWRTYSNDGAHFVEVIFKNGRVFETREYRRDTRWIKVGKSALAHDLFLVT